MTEEADYTHHTLNPFVSTLSVLSFFFALAMNIFGYTVFYLLQSQGIPVVYGGLGTTIGQIVLLLILLPQGRAIDKGASYALMTIGAIIYSTGLIILSFLQYTAYFQAYVISSLVIGVILVTQNTFKASLTTFIGKAAKLSLLGKNYSRIILMETIGGTAAMFVVAAIGQFSNLSLVYLIAGIVLLLVTMLTFFVLYPKSRNVVRAEENKTRRPTFRESLSLLRSRKEFLVPILLSKIFMSVGTYGISYYFILTGERIGVRPEYSILLLGIGFAISVPSGLYSEKYVDRHPNIGKGYVILLAFFDIPFYGFILAAIYTHDVYLFYTSMVFNAFGPLFVSGGLSYDMKVVGKENRGMFGALQRTLVGITFIVLGLPFAYLYNYDFTLLWILILATAMLSTLTAALIPPASAIAKIQHVETSD